jgi:hypothetical protein
MRTRVAEMQTTDEALLYDQVERMGALVRQRPILVALAVGAAGAALGGFVFGRLARLAFLGAVGYVANELWRSEGRFGLFGKLSAR